MPKFYIPEHVKKERAERKAVAKVAHRDLCQAAGEAVALERQKIRKKQQSDYKLKLQKQSDERKESGDALNSELSELRDEGFQFSLSLARQKTQNRIDSLTLDRDHYTKEIQKFKDQEFDSGFLVDELDKIETDLNELNIDYELLNDNHDVNHNHDIN